MWCRPRLVGEFFESWIGFRYAQNMADRVGPWDRGRRLRAWSRPGAVMDPSSGVRRSVSRFGTVRFTVSNRASRECRLGCGVVAAAPRRKDAIVRIVVAACSLRFESRIELAIVTPITAAPV